MTIPAPGPEKKNLQMCFFHIVTNSNDVVAADSCFHPPYPGINHPSYYGYMPSCLACSSWTFVRCQIQAAPTPPDLLTTYIFDEVPTTTRVPSLDTSTEVAAPVKVVVPEASMISTSVEVPITLTSPFPENTCTAAE